MKRILGLDLGTTSIGFAYVKEAENDLEQSSIEKIGVRVNPLTTDEQTNFEKGKPLTTNADRTLKRGARRNLDRYQLRRKNLIEVLKSTGLINEGSILTENGSAKADNPKFRENWKPFEIWQLRAKAATDKIGKEELARVFLAINKKRGYKSSRKAKNDEEGKAIDGMAVAKRLYEENLTPGQLAFQLLEKESKHIPDFYRSDLQEEFDKVWECQRKYHTEIFTEEFYKELQGKGQKATSALFWKKYGFNTAENKGKRDEKKLQAYQWRNDALTKKLTKEEAAYVITEINNDLNKSSGYLGAISDRSKELYFNKQTVGQALYKQLQQNPHTRLKSQVFYRQDYMDEFETIWETQTKFHPELTRELKEEIRDIVIFFQRKLKSQKGLISFCEFESKEIEIQKNGKKVKRTIGLRVAPKSSPLFQEFKIWQILNNLEFKNKDTKEKLRLEIEAKESLFEELNLKGNLSANSVIEILGYNPKDWELNYKIIEGNRTNKSLYETFLKILELEGYDVKELLKVKSNKDEVNLADLDVSAFEIKDLVKRIFEVLKVNTDILVFNPELDGKDFEKQPSYQLWHLLYSTEDDTKKYSEEDILIYGNDNIGLKKQLCIKFGFKPEHAKKLVSVSLSDDYGNLSAKAMRNIFPYIKEHDYSKACELAGYRHSKNSLTKDEIENRELKPRLDLLKKNSLRNPVVEKILNQMVNVVNALIDTERKKEPSFRFDEIRIELARELKKNAKERAEMTSNINAAKTRHEGIIKILQSKFGIINPTRNDIIRFKLYEELESNGYKDLYTDTYIKPEILFSKEIDIEHIIPQSRAFDDSFSNKTLSFRHDNLEKGNQTAFDYLKGKLSDLSFEQFLARIEKLYNEGKISKAKFLKLKKTEQEIGDGFAERDLRDSQYIAKKAKNMLFEIAPVIISTSGAITDRLREDWGLINIMKELNISKYRSLGLTEMQERKFGNKVEVIIDWTKRNDHRHHAMDALTVAFTKHNHIQYLNYLNARKDEKHKLHGNIIAIEIKETEIITDENGAKRRRFKPPISNFRQIAKDHLESVLVSYKTKNKVVTKNKNKIKTKNGEKVKVELTPRGQLHKETVYGKYHFYTSKDEKIGAKFEEEIIQKVSNPIFRELLLHRLKENQDDPKKAFTGRNALSKNPIYLDETKSKILPEVVKLVWLESDYSIRKDVTPENFKDLKTIEKVIDKGSKEILKRRLQEFGGDPKKAFSDLEQNPIFGKNGLPIKRVTITGVNNAEPLHYKKDHQGKYILDKDGHKIPVDFVSTGNNHHVAIYKDEKGELQENVVSLFEAVERVNQGLPIIDKSFNEHLGWKFLFTMKQNEYFVFPNEKLDFNPNEIDLKDPKNKKLISINLFRVQKIATKNYMFRHHLESQLVDKTETRGITWESIRSCAGLKGIVKIRINHIGDVLSVGEY